MALHGKNRLLLEVWPLQKHHLALPNRHVASSKTSASSALGFYCKCTYGPVSTWLGPFHPNLIACSSVLFLLCGVRCNSITCALLGLWIFHRPLGGGGGRLNAPPWSRLLVAVEKNERQRSKAREKSFRNHFGHFLAQVKIGVSRGQNFKIFKTVFRQ